jgi:exodeoxyribonuclease VII small subunit
MNKLPKNLKFEDALKRLDTIVEAMESGKIGIEEAIDRYEEAMALHAHCQTVLDQAELRIKKIQTDASGKVSTTAFEPPAESVDESP